ncbi:MAG: ATP-dependent DNA helicase RecG, partial [Oscillospiraceae bacterium]|nr:ATP-dependent DNA helicase RecG [Oscillospiraceae bacterium]
SAKSPEQRIRRGLSLFKVLVTDGQSDMLITFFNAKYTVSSLKEEQVYLFYGKAAGKFGRREMASPLFFPDDPNLSFSPVYPLTEGLSSKIIAANVRQALDTAEGLDCDPLPDTLREANDLCSRKDALGNIHFPVDERALVRARRRLIFEELLYLNLALGQAKRASQKEPAALMKPVPMQGFYSLFPFSLTGAQQRAINDCLTDFCRAAPMNRLLQGDVGSGKTMVAAACAYFSAQNGYQTAMMAPTEILAFQHYQTWSRLFQNAGISVGFLSGSLTAAAKRQIKEQLAAGEIQIIVGTHALLQDSVLFQRLGLVITDEQHRFGVSQRMALTQKTPDGQFPHVLVMSATPIPRTLAFMIYGDLDLSILDEMPKGRRPVKTYLIDPPKRARAYGFIRKHLDMGEQAYIVCPLVEQGENSPEGLEAAVEEARYLAERVFSDYAVGILHGRMKSAEKEQVMADFQNGKIRLLVATTVIEVGVDVPNATVMMIQNAERFGLSQLHQLRGRVGRGRCESFCILVSRQTDSPRLRAICKTNDGFRVAEEDLRLRGPGDFFGLRQHGLPTMKLAGLLEDMTLVEQARSAAMNILRSDPALQLSEHNELKKRVEQMLTTAGA